VSESFDGGIRAGEDEPHVTIVSPSNKIGRITV
jgi:hypothetical protein